MSTHFPFRKYFIWFTLSFLVFISAAGRCGAASTVAQPDAITTTQNVPVTFALKNLLTNDLVGSGNGSNTQLFITSISSASGQGGTVSRSEIASQIWTRNYRGAGGYADANALAVDGGSNVYVVGYSSSPLNACVTTKYRADGAAQWTNFYSAGGDHDEGYAVAVDTAGSAYVTGISFAAGGTWDYATIKYLADGTPAWTNRFDGGDTDFPSAIALDNSDGVFVTGYSTSSDGSGGSVTIKYMANGTAAWTNRYVATYGEAKALKIDDAGNVYVTGGLVTIKYLNEGTAVWTNGGGASIALDHTGDVYVASSVLGPAGNFDYITTKYLGDGTPVWTNQYNGTGNSNDFAVAIALDKRGNVYVAGTSYFASSAHLSNAFVTIKLLPNGTPIWTNRYTAQQPFHDTELVVDTNGNVYVNGSDGGNPSLIKYLPSGEALWTNRFNYGGIHLAVENSKNFYVVSGSFSTMKFENIETAIYKPRTGFIGADTFSYVIQDSVGQMSTGMVSVTVMGIPPAITVQPVSRSVFVGSSTYFLATASGAPNLRYQWRFNDANISGETNNILTITNVQIMNAGGYQIVVTNLYGAVTSAVANLTVSGGPPVITAQPQNQFTFESSNATFVVGISGPMPFGYQWRFNGTNLPGATNSYFEIVDAQFTNGGQYRVVVTNAFGAVTSMVASLTVMEGIILPVAGSIAAIAVQPDGKIVVGGGFNSIAGFARTNVARLHANGTVDTSFNPGGGYVNCVAIQSDGKILVAGAFNTMSGQARTNIARLNGDGRLDTNFTASANGSVNSDGGDGGISSMAIQADGKIVIGGTFARLAGQPRRAVGRFNSDGSLDTTFNPGGIPDGSIETLAIQPDGKVVVAGDFLSLNGHARHSVGRLNADGTLDTSFNPYADGDIFSTAVQADGKILIGGDFSPVAESSRFIRLNSNGTVDSSFNAEPTSVYFTAIQTDGKILIDDFWKARRLKSNGALDINLPFGLMAILPNGWFLAGGESLVLYSIGESSSQTLTLNAAGTALTWNRSGTGPEVEQVTFAQSNDGINYTLLGNGTRITGGWRLTGLSLPVNQRLFVRARGRTVSGSGNGSSGLIESVLVLGPPYLTSPSLRPDGSIQFSSVNFSSNAFAVLASTNISLPSSNWTIIGTSGPVSGIHQFNDFPATNYPRRFYRMRFQ